jgi:thiamine biosynthesis lipoprotein ApbE
MMSAAAWGADSARVVRALEAAHDSVERIDSLMQRHATIIGLEQLRREIRLRTGVSLVIDTIAPGYALDRASLALAGAVDSALLDLGGQYLWIGHATRRTVGIPDPDNTLRALGAVELRSGSIGTHAQRDAPRGAARSLTVLAPTGALANAWAVALLRLGCDRALREEEDEGAAPGLSVVCADSTGLRWTRELQNRVLLPAARAP